MVEQLLNRLINAVENLKSVGNQTANDESNEGNSNNSVEARVNRLFPSVGAARGSQRNQERQDQDVDPIPDRQYVARTNAFNPANTYKCKGKKKQSSSRGQKRKLEEAEKVNSSKPFLKDVIMLPSPDIKVVPQGWKREELYDKMFALSAVEVSENMSEKEIRQTFTKIFAEKIAGLSEPKFNFVRAVGNKIIDPGCQSYDGKVVKYLSKQGPIYIRATKHIPSGLKIIHGNDRTSDESNSDDDSEEQLQAKSQVEGQLRETSMEIYEIDDDCDDALLSVPTFASDANVPVQMNETIPAVVVSCPTCTRSFPSAEIAAHADICADAAEGLMRRQVMYGSLVMQEMDIPELVFYSSSNDGVEPTIVECLTNLKKNVKEECTKIYVRRRLWEDFVHVTKNCKWFKPQNKLKVIFVGEPAIDGGGPKREFFTGKSF